uniref:Uncharacterized protein n=1 Tax=viral metagenome TaxID=1070528 RepID=A0A6M3L367_9ZZZZ
MPSGRVGGLGFPVKWHYPGKKEICETNRKYGLCADMGRLGKLPLVRVERIKRKRIDFGPIQVTRKDLIVAPKKQASLLRRVAQKVKSLFTQQKVR